MSEEKVYLPEAEWFMVVDSIPLRLSFDPQAIREHFCDSPHGNRVWLLSDFELAQVGLDALRADQVYKAFHDALTNAMIRLHGFDPDSEK